jgi:hypothetical protein
MTTEIKKKYGYRNFATHKDYLKDWRNKNKEKQKQYERNTYKKFALLKEQAVKYKGGCCEKCGWKGNQVAFDFHHIDPSKKEYGISDGTNRCKQKTLEDLKSELDKTILLCSNCHRIEHLNKF